MDELYKQIKDILSAILQGDPATQVFWIDQDEGQLEQYDSTSENPENKPPLSYPAALINVEDNISYRTIAGGKQIATVEFYVKLAFKVYEGAHTNVPNDNYFAHYALVKEANQAIVQGIRNCRRINTSKRREKIDPLLHTLRFRHNYLDVNT